MDASIHERYVIERELGHGGMATVYLPRASPVMRTSESRRRHAGARDCPAWSVNRFQSSRFSVSPCSW